MVVMRMMATNKPFFPYCDMDLVLPILQRGKLKRREVNDLVRSLSSSKFES